MASREGEGGGDSSEGELGNFMEEPEDYFQPARPEQTVEVSVCEAAGEYVPEVRLRLLGEHPLWGHLLWNASVVVAELMFAASTSSPPSLSRAGPSFAPAFVPSEELLPRLAACLDVRGKAVAELGAGSGLPSVTAAKLGSSRAVATDFPDAELLDNLAANGHANLPASHAGRYHVAGHQWGKEAAGALASAEGFDLVVLSDLIFNHSAHADLLSSAHRLLRRQGCAVVAFSHHRPHLAAKDLDFFRLAREGAHPFEVTRLCTVALKPMFENDPGDPAERATVHVYLLHPIAI